MFKLILTRLNHVVRSYNQNNIFNYSTIFIPKDTNKVIGVAFDVVDVPGSLFKALEIFYKKGINLTAVNNRAAPLYPHTQMIYIHFLGSLDDPKIKLCLRELVNLTSSRLYKIEAPVVPWFPRRLEDLDQFCKSTLEGGIQLEADHPGFKDEVYIKRRHEIASIALNYQTGQSIPIIEYDEIEIDCWRKVFKNITPLYPRLACREFNDALSLLIKEKLIGEDFIPQLDSLSLFIKSKTGFSIRPVTGLLTGRDFLAALAFKIFFSTQYIRHHSAPLYTPEPDICHEILGHVPMLLNQDFADFSQFIGLASLGACDEDIEKLVHLYWFTVEFGLLYEDGQVKAYGAGVLSSVAELLHATSPTNQNIQIISLNPFTASKHPYPITSLQPVYFASTTLTSAKENVKCFCNKISKGFNVLFDDGRVYTDVDVYTRPVGMKIQPVLSLEPGELWQELE